MYLSGIYIRITNICGAKQLEFSISNYGYQKPEQLLISTLIIVILSRRVRGMIRQIRRNLVKL